MKRQAFRRPPHSIGHGSPGCYRQDKRRLYQTEQWPAKAPGTGKFSALLMCLSGTVLVGCGRAFPPCETARHGWPPRVIWPLSIFIALHAFLCLYVGTGDAAAASSGPVATHEHVGKGGVGTAVQHHGDPVNRAAAAAHQVASLDGSSSGHGHSHLGADAECGSVTLPPDPAVRLFLALAAVLLMAAMLARRGHQRTFWLVGWSPVERCGRRRPRAGVVLLNLMCVLRL